MPAKEYTSVNLLSKDPFSESFVGKILMWALSIGRYIVVFTELVVILSFLSRFTLDRQMTDLNSKINQQLLIVESYGGLEENFRSIQDKLSFVRSQTEKTNIEDVLEITGRVADFRFESNQHDVDDKEYPDDQASGKVSEEARVLGFPDDGAHKFTKDGVVQPKKCKK